MLIQTNPGARIKADLELTTEEAIKLIGQLSAAIQSCNSHVIGAYGWTSIPGTHLEGTGATEKRGPGSVIVRVVKEH